MKVAKSKDEGWWWIDESCGEDGDVGEADQRTNELICDCRVALSLKILKILKHDS